MESSFSAILPVKVQIISCCKTYLLKLITKNCPIRHLQVAVSNQQNTTLIPAIGLNPLGHTALESGCESPPQAWNSSGRAAEPRKLSLDMLYRDSQSLQHCNHTDEAGKRGRKLELI